MKPCARCNVEDSLPSNPYCAGCKRIYQREWYLKTAPRRRLLKRAVKKTSTDRNVTYVQDYLSSHPCVDCAESDPIVLDFDHLGGKRMNISDMRRRGYALATLIAEIEKCVVRCSNCHRRKTAARRG